LELPIPCEALGADRSMHIARKMNTNSLFPIVISPANLSKQRIKYCGPKVLLEPADKNRMAQVAEGL